MISMLKCIIQKCRKKFNDVFNVEMFRTKVRSGKAFAAEQKIREFKKTLLRSKRFEKSRKK